MIESDPIPVHDIENNSIVPRPLPAHDIIESNPIPAHDIENNSIIPHDFPAHSMNECAIIPASINNLNKFLYQLPL
jgi:hypothetical protein